MSKKINTASIGLFIVIGVALGVGGLLLFSSFKLFNPTKQLIVYFDGSLNGLNEGAPVKFRGVTVGSVKRVMVRFNQATNDYAMPVIIELEEKLLNERMPGFEYVFTSESDSLQSRIQAGLRATLESESLVTGVLYVGVDIHEQAPQPKFHQLEPLYPELPSKPTSIKQLMDNLASLDLKSVQTNISHLISRLDNAVGELRMADLHQDLTNLLASANRLVTSPDLTNALAGIRPTLDQYRELGAQVTDKVDPLADSLTNTLAQASLAVGQLRGASENLRTLLAPDAPIRNDLDLALQQLAAAGQSISDLVEFLRRNPNALLVGRKVNPAKP